MVKFELIFLLSSTFSSKKTEIDYITKQVDDIFLFLIKHIYLYHINCVIIFFAGVKRQWQQELSVAAALFMRDPLRLSILGTRAYKGITSEGLLFIFERSN